MGHDHHFVDVRPKGPHHPQTRSGSYPAHRDSAAIEARLASPFTSDAAINRSQMPPQSPNQGSSGSRIVVKEANIDGKGLCYVYDDGTVCQKVINGDMVNPKWGTTKAGKPRKRLGQACNTCREKKIRCDPQIPKCAQCQKFGRECRFESSSRSSNRHSQQSSHKDSTSSMDTPNEPRHERTGSSTSTEALTDRSYSRANSRGSMNVESLLSPSSTVAVSPLSEQPPSKRARLSSSPKHDVHSPSQTVGEEQLDAGDRDARAQHDISFAFDTDPYLVNPPLTMHYLKEYFKYINTHVYNLVPTKAFLRWVQQSTTKSLDEKMLLYAMLAAGTAFSHTQNHQTHQFQFKNIAEVAVDRNTGISLPVVNAQLILSMLAYALDELDKSRVLAKAAIYMAYRAGFNEETEAKETRFGLDLPTYLECRRRTFWIAFAGACYHGNRFGPQYEVQKLNCNIRLACDDSWFEAHDIPDTPILDSNKLGERGFPYSPRCGVLAFLVEILLIGSEIAGLHNSTDKELSSSEYAEAYETLYRTTTRRLSAWDKRVRDHYRVTEPRATGLHVLYHFVGIALHRHARHEYMNREQIERSCRQARGHATRLLEIVHSIHDGEKTVPVSVVAADCPLGAYAILVAIDVVTAAGTISSMLEHQSRDLSFIQLVSGGLEALATMSAHWVTAKRQLNMVKPRIATVMKMNTMGTSSRKVAFFVREPLNSPYGLERDVVYGLSRVRYLQALGFGDKVKSEEDICEMGSQSPY
jgi:Fungal specific transcription factor domain/Fungal Zn(2)-Cys(6) binuclear cluster domain